MTIGEQIAHLKGLAEGLDIAGEKSKEAKLLNAMLQVLDSMGSQLAEVTEEVEMLVDTVDAVSDELMDLEEDFYGGDDGTWPYDEEDPEEEDYDEEDYEDEDFDDEDPEDEEEIYYMVKCPKCNEEMEMDEDTLLAGNIRCECCGQMFQLEIVDEEDDQSDFAE